VPDPARVQVARNAATFDRLVRVIEQRVASRRYDSAVAWARVAASFASTNPCGTLRENRIDEALDAVARAELAPTRTTNRSDDKQRRVLHVLSECHLIGGHVRWAARWIQADPSGSDVVVTRPNLDSPELAEIVQRRGGKHTVLHDRSFVRRAQQLRDLTAEADIVVCHSHADDPVPAVAFGDGYSAAPVIMVNHADHVFGLGAGRISVLLNFRQIGAQAAAAARGYPERSLMVVPTPIPEVERSRGRAEAKRELGIDPRAVTLVTLARSVKYEAAPWHPGFVDVIAPFLRTHPEVSLVAVGPDPDGAEWAALKRANPRQVMLAGAQPDPTLYLDAADVYLDSFPFGSVTSMLEAATRDVPVLASRLYTGMSRLMSSSGPLDDVVVGAPDPESYREELARLVEDGTLRDELGRLTGAAARDRHGATAWQANLEQIYKRAFEVEPTLARGAPTAPGEVAEYCEQLLGIEAQAPLLWPVGFCQGQFDVRDRWSARARMAAFRVAQRLGGPAAAHRPALRALLIPN